MVKSLTISSFAGSICFLLFAFMALLIKTDYRGFTDPATYPVVEVYQTPEFSKPKIRDHKLPEPPPKPELMPKISPVTPDQGNTDYDFSIDLTGVNTTATQPTLSADNFKSDGDARPLVRFDPSYPMKAAREGIEGWVQLSFDINTLGAVTNVRILDAKPKRVFDKSAKQALRKWKYRAKVVDGTAVSQQNMSVRLDFKLNN